MPTMPLSINGVPYTDTVAFLNEVEKVIARDVDSVVDKLVDFISLVDEGDDEYEQFVFTEPVRVPEMYTDYELLRKWGRRDALVRRNRDRAKEMK